MRELTGKFEPELCEIVAAMGSEEFTPPRAIDGDDEIAIHLVIQKRWLHDWQACQLVCA